MARPKGETSNTLFEELADWNDHLKRENVDNSTPKTPDRKTPGSRGPSI